MFKLHMVTIMEATKNEIALERRLGLAKRRIAINDRVRRAMYDWNSSNSIVSQAALGSERRLALGHEPEPRMSPLSESTTRPVG